MSVTVRSGKDKACIPICIPRPSLAYIRAIWESPPWKNGVGWGNKTGRAICCQGWGGLSLRPQRLICINFLAQNLVHDTHSAGIAVWLLVLPLGGHKSNEWGRLTSCQPVDYSLNVWKLPRGSFSEEKLWQSGSGLNLMQLFIKLMRLKERRMVW